MYACILEQQQQQSSSLANVSSCTSLDTIRTDNTDIKLSHLFPSFAYNISTYLFFFFLYLRSIFLFVCLFSCFVFCGSTLSSKIFSIQAFKQFFSDLLISLGRDQRMLCIINENYMFYLLLKMKNKYILHFCWQFSGY